MQIGGERRSVYLGYFDENTDPDLERPLTEEQFRRLLRWELTWAVLVMAKVGEIFFSMNLFLVT
jgi:hypothetical protein